MILLYQEEVGPRLFSMMQSKQGGETMAHQVDRPHLEKHDKSESRLSFAEVMRDGSAEASQYDMFTARQLPREVLQAAASGVAGRLFDSGGFSEGNNRKLNEAIFNEAYKGGNQRQLEKLVDMTNRELAKGSPYYLKLGEADSPGNHHTTIPLEFHSNDGDGPDTVIDAINPECWTLSNR
jgi:hypothetical protein